MYRRPQRWPIGRVRRGTKETLAHCTSPGHAAVGFLVRATHSDLPQVRGLAWSTPCAPPIQTKRMPSKWLW